MKKLLTLLLVAASIGATAAVPASADPPGPGDRQCVPGQNNVGGGPGNSGPGDQQGAPLSAPPSCPQPG